MKDRVILLHPDAPPKPPVGQACNGCGVCCMAQPCPVGMVVSRRLRGPCTLLRWSPRTLQYRCGALQPAAIQSRAGDPMTNPTRPADGPNRWHAMVRTWQTRIASRWIAAGRGCDCALETAQAPTL